MPGRHNSEERREIGSDRVRGGDLNPGRLAEISRISANVTANNRQRRPKGVSVGHTLRSQHHAGRSDAPAHQGDISARRPSEQGRSWSCVASWYARQHRHGIAAASKQPLPAIGRVWRAPDERSERSNQLVEGHVADDQPRVNPLACLALVHDHVCPRTGHARGPSTAHRIRLVA